MGSKRSMLLNGLGDLLANNAPKTTRFVDLFAGSGAVASMWPRNTRSRSSHQTCSNTCRTCRGHPREAGGTSADGSVV